MQLTSRPFGREFGAMARKLRAEYGGAIYHVLNRGDRREPIFQTDRNRALFPETQTEACQKTGWQGEALNLNPARRLHQETTMTWQGIANRLHMGAAGFLANLSLGAERKQEYAIVLAAHKAVCPAGESPVVGLECSRSYNRRGGGQPAPRKLGSKSPDRSRASNCSGRSMKRTLQPRHISAWFRMVRATRGPSLCIIGEGYTVQEGTGGLAGVRKTARAE